MSNDNLPLYHDDLFACYPAMIERLERLVANGTVKTIKEEQEIEDLMPNSQGASKRLPTDGALYVVYDSNNPIGEGNNDGKEQDEEIGFSLVYTVKKYNFRGLSGMSVGKVLARIKRLMNGWQPEQDGLVLTSEPFRQRNPLAVRYANGFAYFSIRYVAEVVTVADDD